MIYMYIRGASISAYGFVHARLSEENESNLNSATYQQPGDYFIGFYFTLTGGRARNAAARHILLHNPLHP